MPINDTIDGVLFSIGDKVELRSLKQVAQHNGKQGQLLKYLAEKDRWQVELCGGEKILNVQPANLVALERAGDLFEVPSLPFSLKVVSGPVAWGYSNASSSE